MRRLLPVVPAALALNACVDFEKREVVLDRRILAMRAEPPELLSDGSPLPAVVQLSALVVDVGDGVTRPAAFEWRSCASLGFATSAGQGGGGGPPGPRFGASPVAEDGRCPAVDDTNLAARGNEPLADGASRSWPIPVPADAANVVAGAAQQGLALPFYLVAQLQVESSKGPLVAQKRVVVAAPLPAGRKPNQNPRLAALYLDGRPWEPDAPLALKLHACETGEKVDAQDPEDGDRTFATCVHTVTPVFDASESEPFEAQRFDGGVEKLRERLRFDWYVDGGSLDQPQTEEPSVLAPQKRDPLSAKWQEPEAGAGPVTLWVVVRDGRGGTSWERRRLILEP